MHTVMISCGLLSIAFSLLLSFSYFLVGLNIIVIILFSALIFCGNGFQYTASYVCAYKDVEQYTGVASAVYGFIQIAVTAIFSLLVSFFHLKNQVTLGLLMMAPLILLIILKLLDLTILKPSTGKPAEGIEPTTY